MAGPYGKKVLNIENEEIFFYGVFFYGVNARRQEAR